VLCRLATYFHIKRLSPLAKVISLLNFVLFGIEIALRCEIGKGLYFPHTVGTVIGALRIGENAVIYHGVTFGAKTIDIGYNEDSRPIVGNNVIIGSGAKVLGGIHIGNNVVIGANAVVTQSIPDNVKVGGIPAIVIGISDGKGGPNE
jgi:serine O-acetyltransferase